MRLDPSDISILLKAMEGSFDPFSMQKLLLERFGLKMHNITALFKAFQDQAVDIHQHFDQRNTTEQLIAALRDARPSVAELVALADRAGFAVLPPSGALEVLVRRDGAPYQDVMAFRAELAKRELAVCRVETPQGYGTGSLIGSDLVLTNHHVVAKAMNQAGDVVGAITCRFDHKLAATSGYLTPALPVAVRKILAWSPHAPEDLQSDGENRAPDRLDYALLKLEEAVGDRPIVEGGETRGFIPLAPSARQMLDHEGLLVLEHPQAKPMKIDLGAVVWTGETRLRHSVNTEAGSSGAPVLDATLNLAALHQAGYTDWPGQDYAHNQAIPLALIAADIRTRGLII
ncbi:MAG: trypsin-like peptidase domain-containing protein [Alphaproteobacteria bacterium]|nr:trypsin-like peptidase domain-containing protein [Alphaproteobacteria bacterium]